MLLCKPLTEIDTLSFCDQGQTCISRWSGNVCTLSAVSGHYSDYWFSTLTTSSDMFTFNTFVLHTVYSRLVRSGSSVLITLLLTSHLNPCSEHCNTGVTYICVNFKSFCLDYKPYIYLFLRYIKINIALFYGQQHVSVLLQLSKTKCIYIYCILNELKEIIAG